MIRRLGLLPLVVATACTQTYLSPVVAEVTATPSLIDLGVIPLGAEKKGSIHLDVKNGVATVLDIAIQPTLGEGFSFEGATPFDLDPDGADFVDVTFHPTEAGFASAVVRIATDARDGEAMVEIRGRAVEPELVVTPFVLDFGPVPVGERATASVHLENRGSAPVVVDAAHAGDTAIVVGGNYPLALAAGAAADLDVTCSPVSVGVLVTSLTFDVGTYRTPDLVLVRANDCTHGLPASYDVDGDGFTGCGGDCDDDDAAAFPGAEEAANAVDDDCDGLVDEGTSRYDDDGDGFCEDATSCEGTAAPGDCHDGDPSVAPDVVEYPSNGIDDDCDGLVDLGSTDLDHDGFGPGGGDCDDADRTRRPGARELVNGVDDDCDGVVDEGTVVFDDDGDGWCDSPSLCFGSAQPGDCHDGDPARNPGAAELPNRLDDDCDGDVDEGTIQGDDDGDGFTEEGGDCDDADPGVNPVRGGCP